MEYVQRAREIIDIEIASVQKVRDGLGEGFARAVELMLEALGRGNKLVLTGLGKSFHIAQKIAATMTSTGSTAVVLHPSEAMHGDLGLVGRGDVVLALSYSGASDELVALLPVIKRAEAKVVALTGDLDSPLARNSDEVIPVTIEREACPLNISPTSSTTATLAMGDALAMVLLEARGFTRDDYAKLHPGGAIGRALLLEVRDIMRTGDRMACVVTGATVRDAMLAMTKARSGSVVIVDDHQAVLGIFTDGDLRRHLIEPGILLDRLVDDVMTPHPVTMTADHLAIDVLAHFREHNIDDLIIVDAQGRLAGMIDVQDLPKMKLF
jgi:arabinose-5-phosphate isomerase